MKLKAICELSEEEIKSNTKVFENLIKKYADENGCLYNSNPEKSKLFSDFIITPGYAHCMYRGKFKEGVKVSELELSMLCDGGFSYFGGYSNIYADGTFVVKIYTD